MRDLAVEAAVSFATPFNQFGSKGAIMHTLSERRVDAMVEHLARTAHPADALGRVLSAVDIAVAIMLEEPEVNRAVMGWIGTASGVPGQAWIRSTALWRLALEPGDAVLMDGNGHDLSCLASQLALAFRGALSFWTAGELSDEALGTEARAIARTVLEGWKAAGRAAKP